MRHECNVKGALPHRDQLFDSRLASTRRDARRRIIRRTSFWNLCPESPSSAGESNGRIGLEGGRRPLGRPRGAATRFTMDATCCGRFPRLLHLLRQENFNHPAHFA